MRNLLLSLLALLFSFTAQAAPNRSDPCAPVIRAMDSRLYCDAPKGASAEVRFTTYMSPYNEGCPKEDRVELSSITVTISKEGEADRVIKLSSGEYEMSSHAEYGEEWIVSRKAKLKLRHCVRPMMGGVSIGN
jgi:hypothetical protein